MTITGTIQNGAIVLDSASPLPDGTRVKIEVEPAERNPLTLHPTNGLAEWDEAYKGEFADLARMVQKEREHDLRLLIGREENKSH